MAATKVTIKFIPKNKDIVFDQLNTYRVNDDGSYLLGDLYSGQKKSIVLETLIPAMPIGEGQDIGTFEIQYQDTSSSEIKEEINSIPVIIDVVSAAEFENEAADRDVTLEAAYLLVAKAKSEGIKLADEHKFDEASKILLQNADVLEGLGLNDSRLNDEIKELRQRARNLRERREEFYTIREKKRMFYEADKMGKAHIASYQLMRDRRKDDDEDDDN